MDYSYLAVDMLGKMLALRKAKPQKNLDEALQRETFMLHYIAGRGSEVLPGELCGEMNVSSARVAQALNSIERKGWITRGIDTNDRRKIIVRLTPEGKAEEEKHHRMVVGLISRMLAALGEDDAREYVRITGKLAGIVSEWKVGEITHDQNL